MSHKNCHYITCDVCLADPRFRLYIAEHAVKVTQTMATALEEQMTALRGMRHEFQALYGAKITTTAPTPMEMSKQAKSLLKDEISAINNTQLWLLKGFRELFLELCKRRDRRDMILQEIEKITAVTEGPSVMKDGDGSFLSGR